MYAIVEIAGKQYKVSKDDTLYIPRHKAETNEKLSFDKVLLVNDGKSISVGTPAVDGMTVSATVIDHVKGDKVLVFKKKASQALQSEERSPPALHADQDRCDWSSQEKGRPKKESRPQERSSASR